MVTTCIFNLLKTDKPYFTVIYSIDCTTIEKHNTLIQKLHVHVDKVLHLLRWDWYSMDYMSTKLRRS